MVAPASRVSAEVAQRVPALAASLYPEQPPEIVFHPQCFASHGHFAGDDETRAQAFLSTSPTTRALTRYGSRAAGTAPAAWRKQSCAG